MDTFYKLHKKPWEWSDLSLQVGKRKFSFQHTIFEGNDP